MWQIKKFTFNGFAENTYILYDNYLEAIVIDPGFSTPQEETQFYQFITEKKLTIKYLLNTHCHIDHVFGLHSLNLKTKLKVQIHPEEKKVLDFADFVAKQYNYDYTPYTDKVLFIDPETELHFNSGSLKVLFTPGHSPGSLSFYNAAEEWVIVGDVLFYQSIGRSDLPLGNYNQLITSIKTQLLTLPDNTKVYPGHGQETFIGFEKKTNPYL